MNFFSYVGHYGCVQVTRKAVEVVSVGERRTHAHANSACLAMCKKAGLTCETVWQSAPAWNKSRFHSGMLKVATFIQPESHIHSAFLNVHNWSAAIIIREAATSIKSTFSRWGYAHHYKFRGYLSLEISDKIGYSVPCGSPLSIYIYHVYLHMYMIPNYG